jgi:HD-GYP domain-containing protein (c-di-GMP phosphodiesterase class II)
VFQRIGTLDNEQAPQQSDTAYSEKLQRLGRQLVASIYMLIRSSKLYDPSNAIFVKPVAQLADMMNQIHGRDGRLQLQFTQDAVYLNDALLRLDASSFENVRELAQELRGKKIYGIALSKPATTGDVLTLLRRLTRDDPQEGVDPAEAAFQLVASDLAEKIRGVVPTDDAPAAIDRKKYMLTVYARAIFFLRHFLEGQHSGQPLAGTKIIPIVQQMVDLCMGQSSQFVGLTSFADVEEYPLFHAVNTALLAIVFGNELGLSKAQLRDLGYAAIFHDIGRANLPKELTDSHRALTPEERERVGRARFDSIRAVFTEGALTHSTLIRITVGFQHSESHSAEVRDEKGNVTMTVAHANRLMLYSRIVSICSVYDALTSKRPFREAYGPDVALMMMWTEMKFRFDPGLLEAFVRFMGPTRLEFLAGNQQQFSLV